MKNCPNCGIAWEREETIYETFLNQGYSREEAWDMADSYGCTPDSPKHFGVNVIGIEVQGGYDGISHWYCEGCEARVDRFSGKILQEGETATADRV